MAWIWALLAFFLFFLLLTLLPIRFSFRYQYKEGKDRVTVGLGVWPLGQYKSELPVVNIDWSNEIIGGVLKNVVTDRLKENEELKEQPQESIKEKQGGLSRSMVDVAKIWSLIRRNLPYINLGRRFYRGIRCRKIRWETELGLADPAHTGILYGAFWGIKGYLWARIKQTVLVKEDCRPVVSVRADFRHRKFNTDIDCLFDLRAAHVIVAGLRLWRLSTKKLPKHNINHN